MTKPGLFPATSLLALFALSVCARLPFIDNVLIDEEGIFAYMAVDNGDGGKLTAGNALLVGRLDGKNQFGFPSHPVIAYHVLVHGIRRLNSPTDFKTLKLAERSRVARRPFFFMFLMALALVFYVARWVVYDQNRRVLTICLLLFGCSIPLLVGGSIQPQLDGSWGVLLCAAAAALLFAAASATGRKAQLLSAMAGFVAAIGKNEWCLALLAGTLAAAGIQLMVHRFTRTQPESSGSSVALGVGILIGSALSYSLDPSNFAGGFDVMHRFSTAAPSAWKDVIALRWPWIRPVVALVIVAGVIAIYSWRKLLSNPLTLIVFLWGVAMFGGFLLTPWSGDGFPRYFCPAAILLLCFLAEAFRTVHVPRLLEIILVGLLLAGTVKNVRTLRDSYTRGISITSLPGISMAQVTTRYLKDYEQFVSKREAAITDAAYGYYFPTASFAAQSMGIDEARKALNRWRTTSKTE